MQIRKGYLQVHHSLLAELLELAGKRSMGTSKKEDERRFDVIKSRIRNKNQSFLNSSEDYAQKSIACFTLPSNRELEFNRNVAAARLVDVLACNIGKTVRFSWNGHNSKGVILNRYKPNKHFIMVKLTHSSSDYMMSDEYPKRIRVYLSILERDANGNIIIE